MEKVKDQDRSTLYYSDDIWAFFQNCWHLKDWIKNDPMLLNNVRNSIEKEVEKYDSLMICADLTNRSKHSELKFKIRKDAKITGIGVTVHAPPIITSTSEPKEEGYVEHPFYIMISDGNKFDGLRIAIQAVDDWKKILGTFSLL